MSRYIDADKLYERIRTNDYKLTTKYGSIEYGMRTFEIKEAIDKAPTADVKEVKHGQWTKDQNFNDDLVRCSACHILSDRQPNYCPYCGARMDGGVKE